MAYDFSKVVKIDNKILYKNGGLVVQMKNEEPKDTVVIGGKTYRTVTIGNQTWLAQNLDLETDSGSVISDRRSENEDYGRLYQWDKAVEVANSVEGWHLPSRLEWIALYSSVGVNTMKLKATSGWSSGNGTDDYGFGVLPAGYYNDSSYYYVGRYASFWTSDEGSSSNAYGESFDTDSSMNWGGYDKSGYLSVRLIKDN